MGRLVLLRRAAQRAFDLAMALPKGAIGRGLCHTRTVLAAIGANPTRATIAAQVRNLGSVVQDLGPVTIAAATLRTPAVWATAIKAARWAGAKIADGAKALWRETASLLHKIGPAGDRVVDTLRGAGQTLATTVMSLLRHRVSRTVWHGFRSAAAMVRPVAQAILVHRLAVRLIANTTLRIALLFLVTPLVLGPRAPHRGQARSDQRRDEHPGHDVAVRRAGRLDEVTLAASGPGTAGEPAEPSVVATAEQWLDQMGGPLNRAERRARQEPKPGPSDAAAFVAIACNSLRQHSPDTATTGLKAVRDRADPLIRPHR